METVIEIRNRLRAERPARRPSDGSVSTLPQRLIDPAFAMEDAESQRVTITTPMREAAAKDPGVLALSGRLVEAEHANRNGAFWTQKDLEFGLPSVAMGPLNWLHQERKIVGALRDPRLVSAEQAAAEDPNVGTHIATDAVVWSYIYPEEASAVRRYIEMGRAWLSMECVAASIQCTGPNGCGLTMPYADAMSRSGAACDHVKERASHRRFVDPVFRGAGIIVPPVEPGWANANLGAQRAAESVLEAASFQPIDGMDDETARLMVAQIIAWSRRAD